MNQAELDFRDVLHEAVSECRKIGYHPTRFLGMINRTNPFEAVRSLLVGRDVSDGFTVLWEKGRLDLSVEAIVLKPEWRGYFQAELGDARRRLAEVGYKAPWDDCEQDDRTTATEVEVLLRELADSQGDVAAGKRIRGRLRDLGHYGGLRTRENDIERGVARSRPGLPEVSKHLPVVSPPIPDPDALLARIRSISGLPERNHEDVVKDLLIRLGFAVTSILFQNGRMDLCVLGSDRKTAAVFEVKRTIAMESERAKALRQGMDYAGRTGALIVVITDGDRYEIYDRRKAFDYEAMLCGKFQLTAFREVDSQILDLLRPDVLRATKSG